MDIGALQKLYDEVSLPCVYDSFIYEEKYLKADDGVELFTQFYFPDTKEAVSTVVVRNCYLDQSEALKIKAIEYNKRGFGFVVQWCRGTGKSQGLWEPNVNDRSDGLSLMRYLEADERILNIGYWGDSYLAFTGWVMADAVPSKVKTMFLGVYGCDRYTSAYKDGLFRQDILTAWAMGNAGRKVEADYLTSALYRPQIEVDEKLWGGKLAWYRDWISNTEKDSPYWSSGFWKQLSEIPSKIRFPLFVKEGWYDHHLGSALITFDNLAKECRDHSILQIGPWNHDYRPALTHQDITNLKDDSAKTPMVWFDRILRKQEKPEAEKRLYMIGQDCWLKLDGSEKKSERRFYLSGMSLSRENDDSERSFVYDPENPLYSHGAESLFNTKSEIGSLSQPETNYRSDVLSYVSDSLDSDLKLLGSIRVHLEVASEAEDTAFSVKLMEIFEDGTAVNIRGSITTLAFRNGSKKRLEYVSGEKVGLTIDLWDIAWCLKKGSKLRLDISSSDFPQYSIHSNTKGVWSFQNKCVKARQTVFAKGSYVTLPLLEDDKFAL